MNTELHRAGNAARFIRLRQIGVTEGSATVTTGAA